MTLTGPLKWHGGKQYLASRVVALMPPHVHYVEPFAGGLAVLLAKSPEGVSEVVNDLDGDLINFWMTLQSPSEFENFRRWVEAIPFSEDAWGVARRILDSGDVNDLGRAVAFFVCCRQSLAGRMRNFAPLSRTRVRRGMNEQASAWLNAVKGLSAVHARLKRVVIFNRDALDVIRQQDGPNTLFYCDPPYLHESRATTGEYAHEMTDAQHEELWRSLAKCKGKWMLSGYPSPKCEALASVYATSRRTFDLPNNAAGGESKRRMTECVWCNFPLDRKAADEGV